MSVQRLKQDPAAKSNIRTNRNLISVSFEVFGRVQGVFFRKYTQKKAKTLGLCGWCMNTEEGTVQGVLEGPPMAVRDMKEWLQTTGSPKSSIQKAVFTDEKELKVATMSAFMIKRFYSY